MNGQEPGPPATMGVMRPARALIGWMNRSEALLCMTSRRPDVQPTDEQVASVDQALAAVAAREPGIDQSDIVQEVPAELETYVADLASEPAPASLLQSGARVAIVDISRVCGAQPLVHSDHAEERTASANEKDVVSIARISLPVGAAGQIPGGFDNVQKAWVFSAANPNLRITGAWSGPINGAAAFGFQIAMLSSFVSVARYKTRYVLTDGYHRAHGLLRRGINFVPAFVRDVQAFEGLGFPAGMLSQDTYLGERPPTLADYLDDEVASDVSIPAVHKVIVVAGMEVQAIS